MTLVLYTIRYKHLNRRQYHIIQAAENDQKIVRGLPRERGSDVDLAQPVSGRALFGSLSPRGAVRWTASISPLAMHTEPCSGATKTGQSRQSTLTSLKNNICHLQSTSFKLQTSHAGSISQRVELCAQQTTIIFESNNKRPSLGNPLLCSRLRPQPASDSTAWRQQSTRYSGW
jgi:hypothetical protein